MESPTPILLCVLENYFPKIGGVETLFQTLNEKLVDKGYEVHVVTSGVKGEATYEVKNGVHIHRTLFRNRLFFPIYALPLIFRRAKNAQLLQTTTYAAAFPAYLVAMLRKKKIVVTFHEYWGKRWWSLPFMNVFVRMYWIYEQLLLRIHFDAIVAVSQSTASRLIDAGVDENKIEVIYNGLPDNFIKKDIWRGKLNARKFLYVGRLGVSKGLDLLLPAFYAAYQQHKDIHLDVIVHNQKDRIAQWMNAFQIQHSGDRAISFLPALSRKELENAYTEYDALIIPSRAEGFGFVAVEAAVAGIPVVVSDVDSLPEVVGGKHIFVDGNSEEALCQGILQAREGRYQDTKVPDFSLDVSCVKYQTLYDRLLSGKNLAK